MGVANVASAGHHPDAECADDAAEVFDGGVEADAAGEVDAYTDRAPPVRFVTPGPVPRLGERGPRGVNDFDAGVADASSADAADAASDDAGVDAAVGEESTWVRPKIGLEQYHKRGEASSGQVHTQQLRKGLVADDEAALADEAVGCSSTRVSGGSLPRLAVAWLIGLVVLRARRRSS